MNAIARINRMVSSPRAPGRNARGFLLLESVFALAITATAGMAALGLISVSAMGSRSALDRTTASVLATSQAEEIRAAAFQPTPSQYPAIPAQNGFTVANETSPFTGGDEFIQNVLITVSKGGEVVLALEMVKVDR